MPIHARQLNTFSAARPYAAEYDAVATPLKLIGSPVLRYIWA